LDKLGDCDKERQAAITAEAAGLPWMPFPFWLVSDLAEMQEDEYDSDRWSRWRS